MVNGRELPVRRLLSAALPLYLAVAIPPLGFFLSLAMLRRADRDDAHAFDVAGAIVGGLLTALIGVGIAAAVAA